MTISMQAPEDIAKFYLGDKQKIFQALQSGALATFAPPPYDQMLAVATAMHIDRMQASQAQQAAKPLTVAQEVMGGASPAPIATPPMGAGSDPSAAPPMTPPMAPPMGAPPMGMAEGGIAGLDIPDTMFDEDGNGGFDDGYAGGGLVAFGAGSPGQFISNPQGMGDFFERMALEGVPGINVTSRKRTAAENAAVGGNPNSYHLLGAARDFVPPKGMTVGQLHQKLKSQFGAGYDVINEGDHVHVEPGPALGRGVRGEAAAPAAPAAGGLANTPAASTLEMAVPAAFKAGEEYYAKNMPERTNEGLNILKAEARKILDPAEQKRQERKDEGMTLAEIGFNMAASDSPYLLQAVGKAAAAALPGARAAKKEREAAKREAIRDLASAEDITYKQAAEKANAVREYANMTLGLKDKDLTRAQAFATAVMEQTGANTRATLGAVSQIVSSGITAGGYNRSAEAAEGVANRQNLGRAHDAAMAAVAAQFPMSADTPEQQAIQNKFYQERLQFYMKQLGASMPDPSNARAGASPMAAQADPAQQMRDLMARFGSPMPPSQLTNAGQGNIVSQGRIVNAVPISQ